MALYYNLTWQDIAQDSRAQSLGLNMTEDLFDDRVSIYLTTDAIISRINKLLSDNLGLTYATAFELHTRKFPNLDEYLIF